MIKMGFAGDLGAEFTSYLLNFLMQITSSMTSAFMRLVGREAERPLQSPEKVTAMARNPPVNGQLASTKPREVFFGTHDKQYVVKPEDVDGHVLVIGGTGSGKIKCAYCNSTFKRRGLKTTDIVTWQCSEAVKYGREKINANGQKIGCNCQSVHEQFLKENFLAVLDSVIANKNQIVETLKKSIRKAIAESPNKSNEHKEVLAGLEKIASKKSKSIDMYTDGLIKRTEFEKSFSQYDKQQEALTKQLSMLDSENKIAQDLQQKLDNVDQAVESLARLKEFGDLICLEVLHKVVVEGRDKISFYLTTTETENPIFFKIPPLLTQSVFC